MAKKITLPKENDADEVRNAIEKKNRERMMTFLLMHPHATLDAMVKKLDLQLWGVRELRNRIANLGWIKQSWFPSRKMLRQYQQFFVFVETSYEQHDAPTLKENQGYQEWVKEQVEEALTSQGAPNIVLGEVEVLLGGPFDMLIRLYAKDADAVHTWVADELRKIHHIRRSTTSWARKFYRNEDKPEDDVESTS